MALVAERLPPATLPAASPFDAWGRARPRWTLLEAVSLLGAATLWPWLALSAAGLALLGLAAFEVNRALRRKVERRTVELATAMAELERTQRALRMLTACSEAILRATGEQQLYAAVCRAIVDTGGYRMCWVGIAEEDPRRTVRPVAYAGHEDGYLHRIDLVWADAPGGQGPTGTAIREGRCVVGQDFATTPSLIPWREEALRRGYRSSSALPLSCEGERIGALTMYSSAVSSFSEEELGILRRLADDLAFGAHALRQRAAKARADAERENALRALSLEQERFRGLIENSSDLTLVLDEREAITFASPSSREVLGLSPAELVGQPGRGLLHPDDQPRVGERFAVALARPRETVQVELRMRRADGTWARLEARARNLSGVPGIRGVVINSRDVSERHRLQEQIQQAQKLESVGRLAGGVAHDFNNLLTVILGGGEDLRRDLREGRLPDPGLVDDVLDAGRRAAELTRQLLAFARKQVIAPARIDLNELIRSGARLVARVIGEDVRTVMDLQTGLWPVRCDPGLLNQVIMNLAVNARDAMPAGGTLTLATENVDLPPGAALPEPDMAPGPYVRLTVADTGTGMSSEVREHLFEPFFTTKAAGAGTGLGLATVYGIMRQSGGFVSVQTALGQGTRFEIHLPRDDGPERSLERPPAVPGRGSETVLVVEDEPKVREMEERSLREGGYRVLAASSAEEAARIAQEEPGPLDLILTDVVMPSGGGPETVRAVSALRPGVRVLYVSGYAADAFGRYAGMLDDEVDLLPKPFTSASLLARVRAALDRRGGS